MSKYVNIMAKVSPQCASRLEKIRERNNFRSKYEVVQAAVALMLMYADPEGEEQTTEGIERVETLRSLFGSVQRSRELVSRVKPNGGKHLEPSEIIAFYGRETLMLRTMDEVGNIVTTSNIRDILETTLLRLLPEEVTVKLKQYRRAYNHPTLLSALMAIVARASMDEVSVEVGSLFSDLEDSDPRRVKLGYENKPARAKTKRYYE